MAFWDRLAGMIMGHEELEEDLEYEEEEEIAEEEPAPAWRATPGGKRTRSIRDFYGDEKEDVLRGVVITSPQVIEDACDICEHLKNHQAVVVILSEMDAENSQRFADFLGGVNYALNGAIERVTSNIFVIAPSRSHITNKLLQAVKSNTKVFPMAAGII